MKVAIKVLKDFDKEYIPFQFNGFWGTEGYCYLRVQVRDGKFVFITGQLFDYHGTSITNAAEEIQDEAIRQLVREDVIQIGESSNLGD